MMANFCSECGEPVPQGANFCTSCGASLTGKSRANMQWSNRRERVLGSGPKKNRINLGWILVIVGGGLIVGWVYANLPEGGNPLLKEQTVTTDPVYYGPSAQQMASISARVENGKVVIPLDLVKEKKFVRFIYGTGQSALPLLAYISNEGKIVTAVSLCEPCNSTAFHIQADKIICNSCGSTWELNTLEAVSGSCGKYPPDALPNTIVGNAIQIDEQLVARWQRRA